MFRWRPLKFAKEFWDSEVVADSATKPSLRLFLSADLAGSTAFKQSGEPDEWQKFFRNFYQQLPAVVIRHAEQLGEPTDLLKVWKLIGDEVVFSTELKSWDQAGRCLAVFRNALFEFRRATVDSTNSRLDVKAAAWTAGFPVGNIRVEPMDGLGEDYVGPGMDIGFRLVKAASPRRMLLSVELAWLLSLAENEKNLSLFLSEGLELKGVAKGQTYPCIWLDNFRDNTKPTTADELFVDEENLRGKGAVECKRADLHDFAARWIRHMGPPYLMPFIDGDPVIGERPANYQELYSKVTLEGTQGPNDDVEPEAEPAPTAAVDILAGLPLSENEARTAP